MMGGRREGTVKYGATEKEKRASYHTLLLLRSPTLSHPSMQMFVMMIKDEAEKVV